MILEKTENAELTMVLLDGKDHSSF